MKKWIFPLLFMVVLFSEEIFHAFLCLRGIVVASGLLQRFYIPLLVCAMFVLVRDFLSISNKRYSIKIIKVICIILLFYAFTYLFYGKNDTFTSSVLNFGSIGISSIIVGGHFACSKNIGKIDRLIPFFVIPLALVIGTIGFRQAAIGQMTYGEERALNYQQLGYYMVKFCTFSMYYIFFSSVEYSRMYRLLKFPIAFIALFSAIIGVASGGRGALVLLGFVIAIFVYCFYKKGKMSKGKVALTLASITILFLIAASYFNLWETAGFTRVSESLFEDSQRDELHETAYRVFLESPIIGHGLGAIWVLTGYSSHSLFYDLLVDGGILGLILFLYLIFKSCRYLIRDIKDETLGMFIVCALSKDLILVLFSGYFMNAPNLLMGLSFVYIYKKYIKNRTVI